MDNVMDVEQMKIIMETLEAMGAAGKDAFIWWLLLDKAAPLVGWMVVFGGSLWAVPRVVSAVGVFSKFAELRDELCIGSSGYVTEVEARLTLERAIALVREDKRKATTGGEHK